MLSPAQAWGWPVGFGVVAVVLVVVLLRLSRAAADLRRLAWRVAEGDLSRRPSLRAPWPLTALAAALHGMIEQLDRRFQDVVRQRNQTKAILSSMLEGVLAIDQDERLISLNRAAAQALRLDPSQAIGRSIPEVVRNHALQLFVTQTLHGDNDGDAGEQTITFSLASPDNPHDQRFIQAHGAVLRDGEGRRIGAVIVLHDVTRLRRLETVRRDFVANVSHEIKTPVSAIKAAIETLLDDPGQPRDQAEHFMKMVQRQADRLDAIVDDLLSLARIEQQQERMNVELSAEPVAQVIGAAVEAVGHKAAARGISLEVVVPPDLCAMVNPSLLEQAIINLLDNAVTYSHAGASVTVAAAKRDEEVVIEVIDRGIGIEPQHLPRLFERFYRPDRARGRAAGGTGLGLAIVKHIVQAHGGRAAVQSTPGQGSTFSVHLKKVSG